MSDSDSSNNEIENKQELYDFTLIEFVHRGKKKKLEDRDIVPSKWLSFDNKRGKLVSKFLDPPYNEDRVALLHTFVKCKADAPDNWPVFTVKPKGRASEFTYNFKLRMHYITLNTIDYLL